jgi:hypothetical protein
MPEDTDAQDSQPQSSPAQPNLPPPPEPLPVSSDWGVDISQKSMHRPPSPEPDFLKRG